MGRVRVILCALFLIGMAAAPVWAESVVRVESDDEVLSWDPHAAWHLMSINACLHVYEPLVHVGPDLRLEPSLAISWRLATPTEWEIELRPGVRFQDGTPLAVSDVAFSLARAKGEDSDFRRYALGIVRVEDAGGGKVRIVTEHPDPLLPNRLSTLRIMSKAWAEAHNAVAVDHPERPQASFAREHAMGTGPFRLAGGGASSTSRLSATRTGGAASAGRSTPTGSSSPPTTTVTRRSPTSWRAGPTSCHFLPEAKRSTGSERPPASAPSRYRPYGCRSSS